MWAERFGVAIRRAFAAEGWRFFLVFVLWFYEIIASGVFPALIIALVAFVAYRNKIYKAAKLISAKKFPYPIFIVLFSLALYVLTFMSSSAANFLIMLVTGFHPAEFPAAVSALQIILLSLAMLLALTVIFGIAALTMGFSTRITGIIASIAFMLAVPCTMAVFGGFHRDQDLVDLIEGVLINTSFTLNKTSDGDLLCPSLKETDLVAPDSNTGFIVAIERNTPPPRAGRSYTYAYRKLEDCPIKD